jgi:MinD superfamily P-loop ATPase
MRKDGLKQILVISGKGGTGKTVVTGALCALAQRKVIVDADVDAANLYLILDPQVKETHTFTCGQEAWIDPEVCAQCGACREVCRYGAIREDCSVDPVSCEGCGFCSHVCPAGAITMREKTAGEWYISQTKYGPFVHARLGIAEDNSGKLVSLIKQEAKKIAEARELDWIIVDGPPGIGCPVIASLSGVDCAVVVTEPTLSGLHDARRVIGVARHFRVPVQMVINKFDLNEEMTARIEEYCRKESIQLAGKITFDENVVRAVVNGSTVVEYPGLKAKDEITRIWEAICGSFI